MPDRNPFPQKNSTVTKSNNLFDNSTQHAIHLIYTYAIVDVTTTVDHYPWIYHYLILNKTLLQLRETAKELIKRLFVLTVTVLISWMGVTIKFKDAVELLLQQQSNKYKD